MTRPWKRTDARRSERPDPETQAGAGSKATGSLALAARFGAPGLRRVFCWQIARTLFRLAFLGFAAVVVGTAVMGEPVGRGAVAATIACLALAALAADRGERDAAAAEGRVAEAIRGDSRSRVGAMGARRLQAIDVGALVVGMQRHPDAIAPLTVSHAAARRMMAVGPLLAAAALAIASVPASLAVLALTPVMIVFFVLVGGLIRQLAGAQEAAFGHLAGQFADRIRTLPTILANHALPTEADKLRDRMEIYADRTVGVLRIAFLNAAVIDFFASLSVAILAILLGLGHLKLAEIPGFSGLDLWQSLFILMIAPDYFAPFRRFAEQYHAKAEGEAAADALDALLAPPAAPIRAGPDVATLEASLPPVGLVAICGPSGAGKTTLLRAIAQVDRDGTETGEREAVSWIGTDGPVRGDRLQDAIARGLPTVSVDAIADAAAKVGLMADATLPQGLEQRLQRGGTNLSGGQMLRVSIARALLSGRTVIADEPTAKLDAATASLVRAALADMARTRLVLVATHDVLLARSADRTIRLGDAEAGEKAA